MEQINQLADTANIIREKKLYGKPVGESKCMSIHIYKLIEQMS